ncbi:mediator of RNA polymerase II transcription subunit 26 [Podarcis muralis]
MTAAPGPSPQQIRDRLLQAVDPNSNIRNMVAVLEVISSLERYPITKEALEETRLGKLINDVRKKTENVELAKRAKKLLRNWQKLIEPGAPSEGAARGPPNPPGSANGGGAHNCRVETPPAAVGPKPAQDAKVRNDVQKLHSPKQLVEKPAARKRRGEPRDGLAGAPLLPLPKASKACFEVLQNSSPPPTNGIGGSSPDSFPSPPEAGLPAELVEGDKLSKIPINAVRPHTSSPGLFKPSASSLLKVALLVQQEKEEAPAAGQPKSPRCSSFSPRHVRAETFSRQHTTYSPKGSPPAPSPTRPPPAPDTPAGAPLSPPALVQPALEKRLEAHPQAGLETPLHGIQEAPAGRLMAGPPLSSGAGPLLAEPLLAGFSPDPCRADSDGAASGSDSKKKKKYRPKDYVVNLDGQALEGGVKPVRLKKERRLTFDPMTGEIKPLAQRDSLPSAAHPPALPEQQHRTGAGEAADPKPPLQSPFEQTNWKELSRNEIIQSYLNRQSSLLSSSGVQTPGAHYFMSEYLKQEESTRRDARKTHVLAPHSKPTDLPGVTREVTRGDLDRICGHHWPGVNGCYDTQGNWYDWTQGISLDPHGDDGRLNVLPYVCLD